MNQGYAKAKTLRFREDGTFKIVQFTDPEFYEDSEAERAMEAMMLSILEAERPDLVVYTGDVIASAGHPDPAGAFRRACEIPERAGTPWAAVFGNHDSEGTITREQLHALQLTYPLNYAKPNPPGVHGAGNYVLSVAGSDGSAAAALYFLDSGSYSPLEYSRMGFYDWIRRDQIEWYAQQSYRLTDDNGGVPLPALAFFHIPLPEYNDVWDFEVCYGERYEVICAPWINSGMFAAMIEMGDVMGTFAGHDHGNDYWGEWRGIRLCYGRTTRNAYLDRPCREPESSRFGKANAASTPGFALRTARRSPSNLVTSRRDVCPVKCFGNKKNRRSRLGEAPLQRSPYLFHSNLIDL